MRVIAGSARGRRLVSPPGTEVRPTTDRVRESMFNRLESLDLLHDAVVLDLFAGSGALGIEALSRGARSVTFVERDAAAARVVRQNLDALGFEASVHRISAERYLDEPHGPFDLALLDPPYDYDDWVKLLGRLDSATAVIESERVVELPDGWREVRSSRYGRTHVAVVERV